ncbi:MAG: hypothetical protein ACRDHL_14210 [Candidatus Promineifilaceae bacterium]
MSRSLKLATLALAFTAAAAPEWPAFQAESHQLAAVVGQRHFDFLVWGLEALAAKGQAALLNSQAYLDAGQRKQVVLDYLALLGRSRQLESEVALAYADPAQPDAAGASQAAQAEAERLRAELRLRQPLAEAILQEQVAAVLAAEGLDVAGRVLPPVQMQMTPLPQILIVSPRDEIRQLYSLPLQHGLALAEQEAIEAEIQAGLNRSALVAPIGGLGFYPAMIIETADINFLADVIAHEWTHHWLAFQPLGMGYLSDPVMRTINETVASIVGEEIGRLVIGRYYPEFAPRPAPAAAPPPPAGEPPAFDFNAEMRATRVRVDALLAAGEVEAAEAYMEARRQFFWDHGYRIRRLNQAYFAFYGAYAATPGEAGADPIGPALVALRQGSPSLRAFLEQAAAIGSPAEFFEEIA